MLFDSYTDCVKKYWNERLAFIASCQANGRLDSHGGTILFPNMLLLTDAGNYFAAELLGATKTFNSLTAIRQKVSSIYKYLSHFDDALSKPLMTVNGSNIGFRSLCLAHPVDIDAISKRFPFVELWGTRLVIEDGEGSLLSFGENFRSCFISNSCLVNRHQNIIRCKNVLELLIVTSDIRSNELKGIFQNNSDDQSIRGIHTVEQENQAPVLMAGHLQSMYLLPGLRETTIGKYLEFHPEIVKQAFNSNHVLYEPYLEWKEHDGSITEKAINPDLIVQREDGFSDIFDLKTAALHKMSLTKGKRSRLRFIDYVSEGIAQLANYEQYFTYPANINYAKSKYNIGVQNPRLILVVGSWDNVDQSEIEKASLSIKDNYLIIDYDTLTQMFLKKDKKLLIPTEAATNQP